MRRVARVAPALRPPVNACSLQSRHFAAYRREEFSTGSFSFSATAGNHADEQASWESDRMSFDLAVWEGDRPATDADASAIYERLMNRMEAGDFVDPPSPRIRAYVESLLGRWPDITEDDGEDSPWADGPLIGNAFGDAIYFGMVWSKAEEASDFAARLAAQHGLVCYDPQSESLRPSGPDEPRDESVATRRAWLRRFRKTD